MAADRPNNRVSMGRNQSEPCCRTCPHMKGDGRGWWGWCQHPSNRVPYGDGSFFTPSQGADGGCDLHPDAGARGTNAPFPSVPLHTWDLPKPSEPASCDFPACAVHHICDRNCTRNAGVLPSQPNSQERTE